MFDYSETGIALTVVALLVLLILIVLCRLFKISPKRIKQCTCAAIVIYVVLLAGTALFRKQSESYTRIGFFSEALQEAQPGVSVYYTDAVQDHVRRIAGKQTLIYPPDWLASLVMPDSAEDISYLLQRVESSGAGFLSIVTMPRGPDAVVRITVYSVRRKVQAGSVDYPVKHFNAGACAEEIMRICGLEGENQHKEAPDTNIYGQESVYAYSQARYAQMKKNQSEAFFWYRKSQIENKPLFWQKNYIQVLVDSGFSRIKTGNSGDYLFLLAKQKLDSLENGKTCTWISELRARIYVFKEMWNKAFFEYEKVFAAEQTIPEAYFYASRMHNSRIRKLGLKNKEAMLEKAVLINPAYYEAQLLLAEHYTAKGYYKKAEKTYERLIAVIPQCADAFLGLAKLAGTRNDVDEVFSAYKRLISVMPKYSPAYYNLGILYWKTGHADEAEAFFNRALNLGKHRDSYYYLGLMALERGDTAGATSFLRKRIAMRTGPGDRFADRSAEKLRLLLGDE